MHAWESSAMADSGSLLPISVIDHILRRYILPLILLAGEVFW